MKNWTVKKLECLDLALPDEILKYKMAGDYPAALSAIARWKERTISKKLKERLELEEYFLKRLPVQFSVTSDQLVKQLQAESPDFSSEELTELDEAGLAEWMLIDGEKHYVHNAMENIMRLKENNTANIQVLDETIRTMKENGSAYRKFRMRASVKLSDEAFYPGMRLKVHLPIPTVAHQITSATILDYTPSMKSIDDEHALFRAICFEEVMEENHEFFVEYEYETQIEYVDLYQAAEERLSVQKTTAEDSVSVKTTVEEQTEDENEKACSENACGTEESSAKAYPAELEVFTQEQLPHIRFSHDLRALAAEITAGMTDPLVKARAIYNYVTQNVKYSYMREYFLIEDIPQYCARNLRGDCGVQALLFITLCRICDIPAKWQSGLYTAPYYIGNHDWALFYVEPYGWRFADNSFGGSAFRAGAEERRQFYFGNLEPYRMVANNAFMQDYADPKNYPPADPYDNQSGEMESELRGFESEEMIVTRTAI